MSGGERTLVGLSEIGGPPPFACYHDRHPLNARSVRALRLSSINTDACPHVWTPCIPRSGRQRALCLCAINCTGVVGACAEGGRVTLDDPHPFALAGVPIPLTRCFRFDDAERRVRRAAAGGCRRKRTRVVARGTRRHAAAYSAGQKTLVGLSENRGQLPCGTGGQTLDSARGHS